MSKTVERFPYIEGTEQQEKILANIRKKVGNKELNITFYDEETYLTKSKAEEKLENSPSGYAVHYVEWNEAQGRPQKFNGYRQRADELLAKAKEVEETPHYVGMKQSTIGCKACKKRIDIVEMQLTNECPYCNTNLLPPTKVKLIEKYKADAEKLLVRADEEELAWVKGKCEKGKHRWLVSYGE